MTSAQQSTHTNNVTVIIIHWRAVREVQAQLKQLHQDGVEHVIVVDNSQDLTARHLAPHHPDAELISNDYNRGFAFACNQGARAANTDWLLFLNPDVEITGSHIHDLVNISEQYNWEAASPATSDPSYSKPVPTFLSILAEFTPLKQILHDDLFVTKTLVGGCLLIQRQTLHSIGGWDERFFLWFEDSDLTKRLLDDNRAIGWAPVDIPHRGGESFASLAEDTKKQLFFTSLYAYADKHFTYPQKLIIQEVCQHYTLIEMVPPLNRDTTTIVIPNVKPQLIETWLETNHKHVPEDCELVVVTSGMQYPATNSQRQSALQTKYPEIRWIYLDKNYGFAHTVNIGLRSATGGIVGTINDDVILPENWLDDLTADLPQKWGSINPVIYDAHQQVETAGITILPIGKAQPITEHPYKTKPVATEATNAACVLYNPQALASIGLFGEAFGSYLEDIDLSLRLKTSGYRNYVHPQVAITHLQHQTSRTVTPHKAWLDAKNWWLVIIRNWPAKDWLQDWRGLLAERMRNISGVFKSISSQ